MTEDDEMFDTIASWIIRERDTGKVLFETFDRRVPAAINTEKYEAVPIMEYLTSLNNKQGSNKP